MHSKQVAFSCKKRGFCGSCLARRMSDTAGRLTDEVIPEIPTRQWVLSLPVPLRYLVAYDNDALLAVTSAFMGVLFAYLRRKAKDCGGRALDATTYYPGAISFIQRFGSSLNLTYTFIRKWVMAFMRECQMADFFFSECLHQPIMT